jgi:hypothetical protein
VTETSNSVLGGCMSGYGMADSVSAAPPAAKAPPNGPRPRHKPKAKPKTKTTASAAQEQTYPCPVQASVTVVYAIA